MRKFAMSVAATLALTACSESPVTAETVAVEDGPFSVEARGTFAEPWAMTFWGDDNLLITEKSGAMWRIDLHNGARYEITGMPEVDYGGQGGLGDVVVSPDGEWVYFSYVQAGDDDTRGAVVSRGRLVLGGNGRTAMADIEIIWRQNPKVTGRGHYSHRIAFSPDGNYLFIASGDRQKMNLAQDMSNNLGAIVRLNLDGTQAIGNPFSTYDCTCEQIWSYGHRNILGLAFSPDGRLWDVEHGPAGGDELNLVESGANYGWPTVSDGEHYNGDAIPDHSTRPDLRAYAATWTPVIGPGGMTFVSGNMFADWNGDLLIAGLTSEALVRVEFDGETAREAGRYQVSGRLREVEQGPDGAIWVLEDGEEGRLLRLTPRG